MAVKIPSDVSLDMIHYLLLGEYYDTFPIEKLGHFKEYYGEASVAVALCAFLLLICSVLQVSDSDTTFTLL